MNELNLFDRVEKLETELHQLKQELSKNIKNRVALKDLKRGEHFFMAGHEWVVARQKPMATEVFCFDNWTKSIFGKSTNYAESKIRRICEKEIQPAIEREVGAGNILEHYADLTALDGENEYANLLVKVRPLSFDEVREFHDIIVNPDMEYSSWTLTPWSTKERGWEYSVCVVCPSCDVLNNYYSYNSGVRPFCILKSNIFVSKGV